MPRALAAASLFAVFVLLFLRPAYAGPPIILRIGGAGAFHLPDKNSTDPQARADRAIVDAFEREHPGIQLESGQGLQMNNGPAAESNLMLQFAGGTAPDVIYVNFRSSATYISQGFLIPLDRYLANDPQVLSHLKPQIVHVLKDVGNGHIYSIPYAQFVQALYYRKDLFQAAGLDPDKPPASWDEFYNDARALTNQQKGQWGFEFGTDPDASAYWWINFLWQAGGEVVAKDKNGRWQAAFDSPAGATALEFYKHLMDDPWTGKDGKTYYGVATHSSTMSKDRQQGKVAMWFEYQSNVIANQADATVINPDIVGIAPMPHGPTGIIANEINAAMWGISSQITDPRVRDAAWQFVKFMGSDEADRIRTTAYVEAGLGSTVNPVSLRKYGFEDYTTPVSRAWLKTNETLFDHGHPEPYGQNMDEIYILLGVPLGTIESNPNADPAKLLARSSAEINSKLTGYVPPRVMQRRRRAADISFVAILLCGVTYLWSVFRRMRRQAELRKAEAVGEAARPSGRAQLLATLFMLPAVLLVLVWSYYPLARGLVMAFQNYRLIGPATFVGLDNFIDCFHQPSFWYGLRNSFLYTAMMLAMGFFLPIFLAIGLTEIPKGQLFFRSLYYLPAVVSPLVVTYFWKIFEKETPDGLMNRGLSLVSAGHLGPIRWLQDPHWAMFAVVLPAIWAAAGPGSIIYLAAMRSIPEELYEAADLDGAGFLTKVFKVTLPTLKPLIYINLVGVTVGAFQASQNIFVQTGGGPLYATHTLGLEIFFNAFLYLRFGYATAAAWIMGSLLIGFTMYQLRMMKDLRFSAANA